MMISVLLAATLQASAAAPPPPAPVVLEAEGAVVVDKVWASALRTCGTSAFYPVGGRVLVELDRPTFRVAPTRLTEAAKASGYQHQVTAIAAARRWRWAPTSGTGVGHWSPWREGADMDVRLDNFGIGREHALVQDAVLHFEVTRKDGRWSAYRPLSPVNATPEAADLDAPPATAAPPCARLTARR